MMHERDCEPYDFIFGNLFVDSFIGSDQYDALNSPRALQQHYMLMLYALIMMMPLLVLNMLYWMSVFHHYGKQTNRA